MDKPRFSISLNVADPPLSVAQFVEQAEQLGCFDQVQIADSPLIWRDVYVTMTLCAMKTNRIKLATGVTHPHLRHPAVTASALASLDELTGGRTILGIGTGDSALHTLGKQPRPLSEVKETVRVFRALTRGEEVEYEGARIRIPWSQHKIPVYVAATGPKSLELAGEIADGIVTQHGCYPPVINWGLEHIKKGAERAGRKLEDIVIWSRGIGTVSEDRAEALEEARTYAATVANALVRYARASTTLADRIPSHLLSVLEEVVAAYDYYEHEATGARHASKVADEVVDNFMYCGTPDEVVEKVRRVHRETGITNISFTMFGVTDKPRFIQELADKVVPHFI